MDGVRIIEVVAALIWDNDKFMICQRPANKARGMLWEFVGGKVETGETKEQALFRECREELAITLSIGDVFIDVVHEYPDITIHLTLFSATIADGVPQKLEHNDIRWITPSEIPNYHFCPADEEILEGLKDKFRGDFININIKAREYAYGMDTICDYWSSDCSIFCCQKATLKRCATK